MSAVKLTDPCIAFWIQTVELTYSCRILIGIQWVKKGDWSTMKMRGRSQRCEVKGQGIRRGSRCEPALLAACLHFSANRSIFLTSACFCSLCRCWGVGEEHHCEADEVSDCSLFCFSSHHECQFSICFKHKWFYKECINVLLVLFNYSF